MKSQIIISAAIIGIAIGFTAKHVGAEQFLAGKRAATDQQINKLPVAIESLKNPILRNWSASISGSVISITPTQLVIQPKEGHRINVLLIPTTSYRAIPRAQGVSSVPDSVEITQKDIKAQDAVFLNVAVKGEIIEAILVNVVPRLP